MGLLDALLGQGTDSKSALIGAVLSMLSQQNGQNQSNATSGGGVMGGLGNLLSNFIGGGSNNNSGGGIGQIMSSLSNSSGSQGGLNNLLQMFQQSGMGEQVKSWVSNNPNMPVSGDQVQNALASNGMLSKLAQHANLSEKETAENLAQVLPEIVNSATPNGQVEDGFDLSSLASKFLGNLGK